MWSRKENSELLYAPIVIVKTTENANIFLAGQISRLPSGKIVGKGDMRAQISQVCQNIQTGLKHVGAHLSDVVRGTTYVTDRELYFECSDERYKYFKDTRPASTLIPVDHLGADGCMIEIECEAVIDSSHLIINKEYLI